MAQYIKAGNSEISGDNKFFITDMDDNNNNLEVSGSLVAMVKINFIP